MEWTELSEREKRLLPLGRDYRYEASAGWRAIRILARRDARGHETEDVPPSPTPVKGGVS